MLRRMLCPLVLFASLLAASDRGSLVSGVDSVGVTVSDLDRSVEFYTRVLTFEKVSEYETSGEAFEHLEGVFGSRARIARLRLGSEYLELTEFLAPQGSPYPGEARSNDRSFQHIAIIVSDMDQAYQRLREFRVRHASPGPQRLPDWNPNAGGIRAFYFRDPDGHPLEVLAFPDGKGAAKWHQRTDKLFLGIDHTAIVVADTVESLRFYRDVLGCAVAGESENYGPEQERLNNVFGAHLRITAIRCASGPGIEFLQYLAPRDGRPYPKSERPNDLLHSHTTLVAPDASDAARSLTSFRAPLISSGVVAGIEQRGFRKALMVRDPDGHPVLVIEK